MPWMGPRRWTLGLDHFRIRPATLDHSGNHRMTPCDHSQMESIASDSIHPDHDLCSCCLRQDPSRDDTVWVGLGLRGNVRCAALSLGGSVGRYQSFPADKTQKSQIGLNRPPCPFAFLAFERSDHQHAQAGLDMAWSAAIIFRLMSSSSTCHIRLTWLVDSTKGVILSGSAETKSRAPSERGTTLRAANRIAQLFHGWVGHSRMLSSIRHQPRGKLWGAPARILIGSNKHPDSR